MTLPASGEGFGRAMSPKVKTALAISNRLAAQIRMVRFMAFLRLYQPQINTDVHRYEIRDMIGVHPLLIGGRFFQIPRSIAQKYPLRCRIQPTDARMISSIEVTRIWPANFRSLTPNHVSQSPNGSGSAWAIRLTRIACSN